MRIILIGFAASYKTTVGKLLAEKFQVEFTDTDNVVENTLGRSIVHIFESFGEQTFRNAESQVLTNLANTQGVISCGGGAVLSPSFRDFTQGSVVVWLQSSAETVRGRLQVGMRPLFDQMTISQLQQAIDARAPIYQKYATFSVSTDGKSAVEVSEEVAQKLDILIFVH